MIFDALSLHPLLGGTRRGPGTRGRKDKRYFFGVPACGFAKKGYLCSPARGSGRDLIPRDRPQGRPHNRKGSLTHWHQEEEKVRKE